MTRTLAEIEFDIREEKRLFRLLALEVHPDKGGDRREWDILLEQHQAAMSDLNAALREALRS